MAKGGNNKKTDEKDSPRILNRKARHDYHILESFECGIVLTGPEVKSIRQGMASIAEGFARVDPEDGQLWLHQVEISAYRHASTATTLHEPKRKRKLLARKAQIQRLKDKTATGAKGMTLVPLTLYFNDRGIAKIELGIAEGKGGSDKRQSIKKREADREIKRGMSRKRIG